MGSSSFHINNAQILYFRVSSINFLRPGLEAFGRDTGTHDSPTALAVTKYIFQTSSEENFSLFCRMSMFVRRRIVMRLDSCRCPVVCPTLSLMNRTCTEQDQTITSIILPQAILGCDYISSGL